MMEAQPMPQKTKTTGDAATDGLFGGLIAGILMILTLILTGLLEGESPAGILARFATGQQANALTGGLVHLAVSGIYGVLFSLLIYWLPARIFGQLPGWLAGLIYSGLLLFLAVNVLLPGLRSPLLELSWGTLAIGHAVYGVALGWRVLPELHPRRR